MIVLIAVVLMTRLFRVLLTVNIQLFTCLWISSLFINRSTTYGKTVIWSHWLIYNNLSGIYYLNVQLQWMISVFWTAIFQRLKVAKYTHIDCIRQWSSVGLQCRWTAIQPDDVWSVGFCMQITSSLSVTVYVEDINDHAPVFSGAPYHVVVDELTPIGK